MKKILILSVLVFVACGSSPTSPVTDLSEVLPDVPNMAAITSISATTVQLAWIDRSNIEDGFIIERRNVNSEEDFQEIGRTRPNDTVFQDNALDPSYVYQYRILAYRGSQVSSPLIYTIEFVNEEWQLING